MLDSICREIKNYFSDEKDRYIGDFAIIDGKIDPPISMIDGQYYRIVNSFFNDDVYQSGSEQLIDEPTFHGAIWLMRPPKQFLKLADDIKTWQNKYGGANSVLMSPYTSESFSGGNYSYSKSTSDNLSNDSQSGITWQSAFANRLKPYRRYQIL